MSEVATGVVKLTFGFLANKIRNEIAERLKDGDVTDEVCRRLIIRELDDIKSKLDGLARSVLRSSLYFLEEGVNRLFQSPLSNANTAKLPSLDFTDTATGSDYSMNEAVALINALESLKIRSNDRFKSAIESFKLARQKATEAFANEALSIEDRIQASQVRMIARILENLEDPEASASDCLQYLKQLHAIRAVRKIFAVLINGGIKSKFNKTKRMNNATSVQVMNEILFEFIKKFTNSSLLARMFAWPTIPLGEKTHHPLCGEYRHIEKLERSGVQVNEVMSLDSDITFSDEISSEYLSVLNSKGDIVALTRDKLAFKVFKRSGESRILCKALVKERRAGYLRIMAMDIDAKDNLYVITLLKSTANESWNFKLLMFDANGNKKLESPLPFRANHYSIVLMAINKDGKIAVLNCAEEVLYIYNVRAEPNSVLVECERSVSVANSSIDSLRFLSRDGAIVATSFQTVYIYKENGELQDTFEKPTEDEEIRSIATNHATKCILVKTYQRDIGFTLLSFSATGNLQDSLCLGFRDSMRFARLISHPNGPVALVHEKGAILLQL